MKHVFGVSSHLAFYLCHKLIQVDNISADDCIFFTTRDYMFPAEYQSIYTHVIRTSYNTSSTSGRIFAGWKFWETRKNMRKFDMLMDSQLKGESFLWYTQVCYNDICSLMVTKHNCVGYYVIEDGSGSYKTENPPTFIGLKGLIYHMLLKPFIPRLFILKNRMIETNHSKFRGCIASNDMCFPLYQQHTRVIGIPFIPVPLAESPDAILSIDPMFMWITMEETRVVLHKLARYVNAKKYRRIAFKHHPYTLSKTNSQILEQYNMWLYEYLSPEIDELDAQISLENSLMAHKCDFYTATSSVAIYAKAMGCDCYSYMPLLRPYTRLSVPIVEKCGISIV